jgi:hypothetical protein
MIKWIETSSLSIKNSLSRQDDASVGAGDLAVAPRADWTNLSASVSIRQPLSA